LDISQNQHFSSQISKLFADLREKIANFEKNPNFGEKDRFFLTIFWSVVTFIITKGSY